MQLTVSLLLVFMPKTVFSLQNPSSRSIYAGGKKLKKGAFKKRIGRSKQLSNTETKRLLKRATQAAKKNPLDHMATNKAPRNINFQARTSFAAVAAKDKKLKLRWTKYGIVLRRPDEIPSGKRWFRELQRDPKLKKERQELVKAVRAATSLSYVS